MKKLLFCICCAVCISCAPCHAAGALDLSGNEYKIYLVCNEDLGDLCTKGEIETDTFIFEEGNFGVESLGDFLGGLLSRGEYSSSGFRFQASYGAIKDLERYEIDVEGFKLLDALLLGSMEIKYTEDYIPIIGGDTIRGEARFIGIKD